MIDRQAIKHDADLVVTKSATAAKVADANNHLRLQSPLS